MAGGRITSSQAELGKGFGTVSVQGVSPNCYIIHASSSN